MTNRLGPWGFCVALLLPGVSAAETVVYVPAVASAEGREGTYWRTLLEVVNPDPARDVAVSVAFLPADTDNRAAREVSLTVPARRSVAVPDVVGTLLAGRGGGALRLRSASTFHASSRTETARPGARPAGVEIPGMGLDRAAANGLVFPLANKAGKSGLRTNVGFLNPGTVSVEVTAKLLGSRLTSVLGETTFSIPALGFHQLNDVFALAGAAEVELADGGLEYTATGPVHGFGIVLSNETGNGTFLAASPDARPVTGVPLRLVAEASPVPEATYKTANFCRLYALPGSDRFVHTFGTGDYSQVSPGPGGCSRAKMGYAFQELDARLAPTGRDGMFLSNPESCAAGDASSVVVGNDYYFLTGAPGGWSLSRYDLATFTKRAERRIPLTEGKHASNDQMLAYVGGRLDASDLLASGSNAEVDPFAGFGTFHKLFSLDLVPQEEHELTEPAHINGSSMLLVDGVHHLVTSTAFWGDLVALRYDAGFRPIGRTLLASRGQWSQGAVFDGERFWVAWVDVSRKGSANIVLGGFDRDWNPVARVPVTEFESSDFMLTGRPGLLQVGNRLYVSYDVDPVDPTTREERREWACRIAVYEIGD